MPTLDWLNRDAAFRTAERVPTRVLRPHPAGHRFGDVASGNLLMHGDNLEALKALLPFYRGQVKCIFIDPPYNTNSAFEHYDDNLEHSQWLTMMLPRLQLLRELLRKTRFTQAVAFMKAKRLDRACSAFSELSEIERRSVAVMFNAGFCAEARGDWAAARALYRAADALTTKPDDTLLKAIQETNLSASQARR